MTSTDATPFLVGAAVALAVILVIVVVFLIRSRQEIARLREDLAAMEPGEGPTGAAARAVKVMVETAVKFREKGVGGFVMSSLEDLSRWATEDRAEIVRVAAPNGTVTILFSDIEASTALNEELGDSKWNRLLLAHDALVRRFIDKHRGHVVKTQGDGFMVAFREPQAAIHAALDIQDALATKMPRRLRNPPIKVRIGAHVGTVVSRDGDYFGRNVAMAARIAAHAEGGQVLVSDDVLDALPSDDDFAFEKLDEDVELKGLTGAHTLWVVSSA